MKRIFTLVFALVAFLSSQAQDHTIDVGSNFFTPQSLTVLVGESVQWTNTGGFHNVNGNVDVNPNNPEGFGNGAASNSTWTFEYTFTQPGTYSYQCDPHASVGMMGTIVVEAASSSTSDIVISEIMYNSPAGLDLEFIELYNNTSAAIDMTDWSFSSGFEYVFPATTLGAGEYLVLSSDPSLMSSAYGVTSLGWTDGALSNGGETIILVDATMTVVDSVDYDDGNGWPNIADGDGPSLVLCDVDSDNNDPVNWQRASTATNYVEDCKEVFANPGAASNCETLPIITFELSCLEVNENIGTVFVNLQLDNPRDIDTPVEIIVDASSTATNGEDFDLAAPVTVIFPASTDTAQTFSFQIIDDAIMNEGDETIVLTLNSTTDDVVLATTTQTITIGDNDIELTNALRLTGIFDGPLTGGVPKGIEVFASDNIDDLSIFGLGSANNGGGTDGEEFTFPAIAVTAGSYIYVTNDSTGFVNFFGVSPDHLFIEGSAANINGDDAVEIFESDQVIDVFGDINVDGSGTDWDYLDSWAYRKSGTGPDGSTFFLENWFFGGVDVFDGNDTNASVSNPFPIGTYMLDIGDQIIANDDNVSTEYNTAVMFNVLGNDILPGDVISLEIIQDGANGIANPNLDFTITYTPNTDVCGDDMITYEVCDANGCDQATVSISVACPVTYPSATIAEVTGVDADGQATSIDQTFELQGIVHGIDFRSGSGLQFTLIDGTGGIALFSFDIDYYEATEGDEIIARGTIDQFNGLTQINPDTVIMVSAGNALNVPTVVTELNEDTESEMVKIENLTLVDPAEWINDGSGFNVNVTNGVNTYLMRIDNDSNIFGTEAPDFVFNLTGIGSQFDSDAPFTDGYQIYPRYLDDIEMISSVDNPFVEGEMSVFPNPFKSVLTLKSEINWERIELTNVLGQVVFTANNNSNELNLNDLTTGVYYLTVVSGSERWTTKVVKN